VRFLIDANLPRSLAELVSKLGHDVQFARDVGLGTAPDIVSVAERFLREQRFLSHLSGRLAVVERDRVRFRPPLP
jgi:predicted nuclease of predicted toxin-antitoxin system